MIKNNVKKLNQPNNLKDVILLFAVPIGVAVLAAIVVYAPRLLAKPTYDFIYSVCDDYSCNYEFNVDSTGYVSQYSTNDKYYSGTSVLHYYDAKKDATRSLTYEEAKRYLLSTSSKSPDGYSLTREVNDSVFLFWSDGNSGWYLKNGAKKKKVTLSTNSTYYSQDIKFLGWVNK